MRNDCIVMSSLKSCEAFGDFFVKIVKSCDAFGDLFGNLNSCDAFGDFFSEISPDGLGEFILGTDYSVI